MKNRYSLVSVWNSIKLRTSGAFIIIVLIVSFSGAALPEEKNSADNGDIFHLYVANIPPFAIEQTGDGIVIDFCREIAQKAGMEFAVTFQPWPRAQETVSYGENLAIMPLGRTEKREGIFTWIGESIEYNVTLISIDSNSYSLDDAKLQSVIVQENTPFKELLVKENITKIYAASNTVNNAKMLEIGRSNIWLVPDWEARWIWHSHALEGDLTFGETVMTNVGWLALSKNVDVEFSRRVSEALNRVVSKGTLVHLLKKYNCE